MKEVPLTFTDGSDKLSCIISLDTFYIFWIELEIYVRSMLVKCLEEAHDAWYKKWTSWEQFNFSNPATPTSFISVCVMEDSMQDYTAIEILQDLTMQIPYLANHVYYTPANEEDHSAVVKMKLFQSYDFKNPYHIQHFSDTTNLFNGFNTGDDSESAKGRGNTSNRIN